jgi:glutathione S-transferase
MATDLPAPSETNPVYTLYYSPGSASMVVHLALLEIGAPYRLQRVDFDAGAQRDPAYLALNPSGVVPTLLIDGRAVTESSALLQILAERHPEAALAPAAGTVEREAWHQWIAYLANPLAAAFRFWFYPADLGASEHGPGVREALQRRIEAAWERLDAHLAAHGPYLLGREFSGADLMLTMLMRWSRRMPRPATTWPALAAAAEKVRARASWKRLYALEELTEW